MPKQQWPHALPDPADDTWVGYAKGIYCWTLQTYFKLSSAGYGCSLVDTLPEAGIILAHRGSLPDSMRPSRDQVLVCIQADWSRHPFAHHHVCQNRAQTQRGGVPRLQRYAMAGRTWFVHHWPQPGLLPRDPSRPAVLNAISYFGLEHNLAPELRSEDWARFLSGLGIQWRIEAEQARWRDYRNTDAVLFVRDFAGRRHIDKPATKLYNAWRAGVVPLCTPESAYVDEGVGDENAVVVEDLDALKRAVAVLRHEPRRVVSLLEAGRSKAPLYSDERIVGEWVQVLEDLRTVAPPRSHRAFLLARGAAEVAAAVADRLR